MNRQPVIGQNGNVAGLRSRARRSAKTIAETFQRRGLAAAVLLFVKLALRKMPMLFRHLAVAGTAKRAAIEHPAPAAQTGNQNLRMAVAVTGGIGDFIVIARFMRDLVALDSGLEFDIFCSSPERAKFAFTHVHGFRKTFHDILFEGIRHSYDLALRLNQTVVVYHDNIRWARLHDSPGLIAILDRLNRKRHEIDVFVHHHPFLDNFLAQKAVFAGATRRDYLHHLAGLPYGGDLMELPQALGYINKLRLQPRRYVTVHNGFDTEFIVTGRSATKCYPHTGMLVSLLKQKCPDLLFVQVGAAKTSTYLQECDLSLIGKTSLEQACAILAHSLFHLDNEGGLVHVASCLGTPAAVIFGPTPSNYFAYPQNLSIDPSICGNCWWLSPTWMDYCIKGHTTPLCLTDQPADQVAERIGAWLATFPTEAEAEPQAKE